MHKFFLPFLLCAALFANERLLYIVHADRAAVEFGEGASVSGSLRMIKIDDSIAFFSDRPNRKGGTMSLEDFLKTWSEGKDNFADVPPNAGFVYYSPSTSPSASTARFSEVNFVLMNPRYDSKKDILTFDIDIIDSGKGVPRGELLEPTLFIDSKTRN